MLTHYSEESKEQCMFPLCVFHKQKFTTTAATTTLQLTHYFFPSKIDYAVNL